MLKLPDFLAPRRCMREPIPEIFEAAALLNRATDAHNSGERFAAEALIREADIPIVRQWTDSLWGSKANHPDQSNYHRFRSVANAPPTMRKIDRIAARMPSSAEKKQLIERYGHHCAFCGIPLIRPEIRRAFTLAYPGSVSWGYSTASQHAAFQCMWLQYDHVVPHSRGGDNALSNLVITCAGCNFGRMQWVLEEVGLIDPRIFPPRRDEWDGLERFCSLTG